MSGSLRLSPALSGALGAARVESWRSFPILLRPQEDFVSHNSGNMDRVNLRWGDDAKHSPDQVDASFVAKPEIVHSSAAALAFAAGRVAVSPFLHSLLGRPRFASDLR